MVTGLLRAIPGRQVTPEKSPGSARTRRRQSSRSPTLPAQEGRPMISKFFIDRPIFANVIAIVIIILGAGLPV